MVNTDEKFEFIQLHAMRRAASSQRSLSTTQWRSRVTATDEPTQVRRTRGIEVRLCVLKVKRRVAFSPADRFPPDGVALNQPRPVGNASAA